MISRMFNRLAYPLAILLVPVLAGANEVQRTISTTGEALVQVAPDEVILQVGVEKFHVELSQAKADNDKASRQLLSAIRELGIEEKHVQTDAMQVEIEHKDHRVHSGVAGYIARRGYSITLKDSSKLESLIDATLSNGANVMMGFEYRTTELRKHRDEARRLAILAAREKAEALAEALGCTIGAPRNINEHGSGHSAYYGMRWGWGGRYAYAQNVRQEASIASPGGETVPLGQIAVQAQVSVVFDLVPAGADAKKQ